MSLTNEEFALAVGSLENRWRELDAKNAWDEVKVLRQYDSDYLRVVRRLKHTVPARHASFAHEDEFDEEDPESLPARRKDDLEAVYDIVYSSTYQVPVLHLVVQSPASKSRLSPDQIHDLLVPNAMKTQIQAVGVMGALSMTDHPVSGVPCHFVHPCRTQEAMANILAGHSVSPAQYLFLWLGLVGGSVGLHVPVEVVQKIAFSEQVSDVGEGLVAQ